MPPFNQFGPHRPPTSGQPAKMLEFDGMGGQAKSVSARGAGVVRECSITERYMHAGRYQERRDHATPVPRRKNTQRLFGAVQEPVRPDARESYPMGQGRTWRPLDAAAQSSRQMRISVISTEIPLHLRRPHGVRHEVVQHNKHVERIRVRSRAQPRLKILDVRPFSPQSFRSTFRTRVPHALS